MIRSNHVHPNIGSANSDFMNFLKMLENLSMTVAYILTHTLTASGIQFPNAPWLPGMKNSLSLGLKTPQNYQLVEEFHTTKLDGFGIIHEFWCGLLL